MLPQVFPHLSPPSSRVSGCVPGCISSRLMSLTAQSHSPTSICLLSPGRRQRAGTTIRTACQAMDPSASPHAASTGLQPPASGDAVPYMQPQRSPAVALIQGAMLCVCITVPGPAHAAAAGNALLQFDPVDILLHNPALAASLAVASLVVVPRVIKSGVKVLVLPSLALLLAYVAATHPEMTQTAVQNSYAWTQTHPVLTSAGILLVATLLLLPSLLVGAGSVVAIAALSQVVAVDLPPLPSLDDARQALVQPVQRAVSNILPAPATSATQETNRPRLPAASGASSTASADSSRPSELWNKASAASEWLGNTMLARIPSIAITIPKPVLPDMPPLPALPPGMKLPDMPALPIEQLTDKLHSVKLPPMPDMPSVQLPDASQLLPSIKMPYIPSPSQVASRLGRMLPQPPQFNLPSITLPQLPSVEPAKLPDPEDVPRLTELIPQIVAESPVMEPLPNIEDLPPVVSGAILDADDFIAGVVQKVLPEAAAESKAGRSMPSTPGTTSAAQDATSKATTLVLPKGSADAGTELSKPAAAAAAKQGDVVSKADGGDDDDEGGSSGSSGSSGSGSAQGGASTQALASPTVFPAEPDSQQSADNETVEALRVETGVKADLAPPTGSQTGGDDTDELAVLSTGAASVPEVQQALEPAAGEVLDDLGPDDPLSLLLRQLDKSAATLGEPLDADAESAGRLQEILERS